MQIVPILQAAWGIAESTVPCRGNVYIADPGITPAVALPPSLKQAGLCPSPWWLVAVVEEPLWGYWLFLAAAAEGIRKVPVMQPGWGMGAGVSFVQFWRRVDKTGVKNGTQVSRDPQGYEAQALSVRDSCLCPAVDQLPDSASPWQHMLLETLLSVQDNDYPLVICCPQRNRTLQLWMLSSGSPLTMRHLDLFIKKTRGSLSSKRPGG